MKKLIPIACMLFISCHSNEKKMQNEIDNYVQNNFKDPKSYEQMSFNITDTLTEKERILWQIKNDNYIIDLHTDDLKRYKSYNFSLPELVGNANEDLKEAQDSLKSHKIQLENLNTDYIVRISGELKYRAKNGFGALDISQARVIFNDSLRMIGFEEIKDKEK